MSKYVESTRRELFKKWFDSLAWPMCEKCSKDEHIAWLAFNAALDSVVIEFPSIYDFHSTSGMKRGCTEAIESLNLGLKIK